MKVDPVYGARPLKRYISGTLETMLAKKLISGEIYNGSTVVIDGHGENIDITVKQDCPLFKNVQSFLNKFREIKLNILCRPT